MKKNYILLSLCLFSATLFAQQNGFYQQEPKAAPYEEVAIPDKPQFQQPKAYLDTLWYIDFDSTGNGGNGFLPQGWTRQDNTGGNLDWIWSDQAPGGQFSTNRGPLNSPTASNGYLSLPMDFYNTPLPNPVQTMDTYVQSAAITITPKASVLLRFTHAQRYCCSSQDEIKVSVSTDGVNWDDYDANFGLGSNTTIPSSLAEINISATVANSSTVYLRFHVIGASHYYWMIDDVHLVEGPIDNIVLEDYSPLFDNVHSLSPVYRTVPHRMLAPINFEGNIYNYGSNAQTNVKVDVSVDHNIYFDGTNGQGNVYARSSTIIPNMASLVRDTLSFIPADFYVNTTAGSYTINFHANSAQTNQNGIAALGSYDFVVNDTALGIANRDENVYVGTTGPNAFAAGGNIGDRFGILVTADFAETMSSISYYVGNDNNNVGARFVPRVWEYDEDSTLQNAFTQVASSPFPYTLAATDNDTWLTLDLFPTFQTVPGSQYVVGFEVVGGSTGTPNGIGVHLGRDRTQETFASRSNDQFITSLPVFMYLNDGTPSWGFTDDVPAIFANFSSLRGNNGWAVGIEEAQTNLNFEVFPNPSNGQFKLNVSLEGRSQYTLNISNMIGQTVLTENITINGQLQRDMDLSQLEKGIYFIRLENGSERHVQKIVIH